MTDGNGIVFSQHVLEARLAQEKAIARAEALAEAAKAKQYAEKDYEMSKMGIDSLYGKKGITEKVIAALMAGGIRNMTDLRKLGAAGIIRLVESPMAANSIKKHVGLI